MVATATDSRPTQVLRCAWMTDILRCVLIRNARTELLLLAARLTLEELAPDCLSNAKHWASDDGSSLGIQWHTDGIHHRTDLPVVKLPIEEALRDPRGIEELAMEVVGPEVARHLLQHRHGNSG
jgi:hypothetical protein